MTTDDDEFDSEPGPTTAQIADEAQMTAVKAAEGVEAIELIVATLAAKLGVTPEEVFRHAGIDEWEAPRVAFRIRAALTPRS